MTDAGIRYVLQLDGAYLMEDGDFGPSVLDAHEVPNLDTARLAARDLATQYGRAVKLCAVLGRSACAERVVEDVSPDASEWDEKGDV